MPKEKNIKLPVFGIVVEINETDHCGTVTSDLTHKDEGEGDDPFNYAMDAIESMILAHALAGVNIEDPAYIRGIETSVEACSNSLL